MFDERKAAHMAGYLLLKAGEGGLECIKLMKLMYIADRIALEKIGFSISSDVYASGHRGLVLSHVYGLMKGEAPDGARSDWSKVIRRLPGKEGGAGTPCLGLYSGIMLDDLDQLSPFDCELMDGVWEEHGGKGTESLVRLTCGFAEWESPADPSQHKEITLESIFKAVGHSDEMVSELLKAAEEQEELDAFLASMAA